MRLWRVVYWFLTGACLGLGLVPWALGIILGIILLLIGFILVLDGAFALRGREAVAAVLGLGAGPAALFVGVILQGVPETGPAAQLIYGGIVISSLITLVGLVALVVMWRTPPRGSPAGAVDKEPVMASAMPPEPKSGNAPATPTDATRLALTSLLLSLAPLVALGLLRLVALGASALPGFLVTVLSVIVYAASFLGSLSAALTGRLALRRAQQQPPQPAVRAAAMAGILLGLLGMGLVIVAGVVIASVLHTCSINPANCG